jgi:hypothetical protein
MMLNRRGLMGMVAALALAAFTGVSTNAEDPEVQAACACCSDACVCPACVCDATGGDCCEGGECCAAGVCCGDAACCAPPAGTTVKPAIG